MNERHFGPLASRRDFLFQSYLGLGGLALMDLLAQDVSAADEPIPSPLAPKPAHLLGKAKRCIFLFMEGAPACAPHFARALRSHATQV